MTLSRDQMNIQNTGIEELTGEESLSITGGGYWETAMGILYGAAVVAAFLL